MENVVNDWSALGSLIGAWQGLLLHCAASNELEPSAHALNPLIPSHCRMEEDLLQGVPACLAKANLPPVCVGSFTSDSSVE